MYDRVRDSYDRVAERYADEIGGELAGKPLDRALLRCVQELAAEVDESTGPGTVADLGCGPGHVASYLGSLGVPSIGIDISPAMVEVGRRRFPDLTFRVGSLLMLPAVDGEFTAAVALYSIIHVRPEDRATAYGEMARVIRPGGWLLIAFHTSPPDGIKGDIMQVEQWWGEKVDLDFYYLDPAGVVAGLERAGFEVMSRTDRRPWPGGESPSQRSYLLCRRS